MYLSLSEKKEYIDKDFKEHVLIPMGELPADSSEVHGYIARLHEHAVMWADRYAGNSLGVYALQLLDDFVCTVQQNMERMYGG